VIRQLREVVDLPPVQDPLAVRLGPGEHPRGGTGGDEHDVGGQDLGLPVGDGGRDQVGGQPGLLVFEAGAADDHPDALALHPVAHVGRLGEGEAPHPAVHHRQVEAERAPAEAMNVLDGTQS
jgi:hypothetical protein